MELKRKIRIMEEKFLKPSLEFVEQVFSEWRDAEEGKIVRELVEEIRRKKYYLPELELLMVDEKEEIIGYVMFSRFFLRKGMQQCYEEELLMLTPAAVKTSLQRQHISKELIEYGFQKARKMGYKAVLVEGNPRNYNSRGFETAAKYNILPGERVHLPNIDCLMVKELVPGSLEHIQGIVEYDFYDCLIEGE